MVRINLINPEHLSDQHLIAEYNEILMLASYIKKHPVVDSPPKKFCLGRGHMKFFKDKLVYLKKRHESLKSEMRKRGFIAAKSLTLNSFNSQNKKDWNSCRADIELIKKRLIEKIKMKPEYYRYYKEHRGGSFFINLLN